jgi:predicted ATP-grasp superfamily ATP-dependent carboligase
MRALIVEDGVSRGTLAAVRALAQAGWTVSVGSPAQRGLAAASRAVKSRHDVPPAALGRAAFLDAVRRAVEECHAEVVFGSGDVEVLTLSEGRDGLQAVVPYAAHDVVVRALDKVLLLEAAAAAGFAVPWTRPAAQAELAEVDGAVVVKARSHSVPGRSRLEAVVCADARAARRRVAEIEAAGGEAVLQEHLAGPLSAYAALAAPNGDVVAAMQQEAEALWPPGAGASVRARTVVPDAALAASVAHLLARLGWFGIAELQLIRRAHGDFVLIDLNGRFYGSLALALAAGLNLPAMWAALATGRRPQRAPDARVGVRYQWLEGDLRRAGVERRGGLFRDVSSCFAYSIGANHSIWQLSDPAPAIRLASHLVARAATKMIRR